MHRVKHVNHYNLEVKVEDAAKSKSFWFPGSLNADVLKYYVNNYVDTRGRD